MSVDVVAFALVASALWGSAGSAVLTCFETADGLEVSRDRQGG